MFTDRVLILPSRDFDSKRNPIFCHHLSNAIMTLCSERQNQYSNIVLIISLSPYKKITLDYTQLIYIYIYAGTITVSNRKKCIFNCHYDIYAMSFEIGQTSGGLLHLGMEFVSNSTCHLETNITFINAPLNTQRHFKWHKTFFFLSLL